MVSGEEIDKAIEIIDQIRKEAKEDSEYGFDDDWRTFMKKMRVLTPQSSGLRMQKYMFRKLGWTEVSPLLNRGDVKNSLGQYFEVKITTITTSNDTANIVQIRLWQNVSGYHIFVIDATKDYELIHFHLSKSEMKNEVELLGSSAHGTRNAVKSNVNVEWAIHLKWKPGGKDYNRWMERYKQDTNLAEDRQ